MIRYWLLLILFLGVFAEEEKKEKKVRSQVVIEAEKSVYNDGKKKSVFFEGIVKLDDGQMKLTCDKLWVFLNDEKQPKTMIAKGDVVIIKDKIKCQSGEVVYDVDKEVITLKNNPVVNQAGHIIRAEVIEYDLKNNIITTPTVRAVFDSE